MMRLFSSRRASITADLRDRAARFEQRYGRKPSQRELAQLAQASNFKTRAAISGLSPPNLMRWKKEAHRLLDAHRLNPKREFFKVSVDEAVKAVRDALQAANGIWPWTLEAEVIRLRSRDRLAVTCREGELFTLIAYPKIMSERPDVLDVWHAPSDGDVVELMATDDPGHVAGFSTEDPGADRDPVPCLDRTRNVPNMPMIGRERLVPGDRLIWLGTPARTGCVIFEADAYCQVVCRTWQPKLLPVDKVTTPVLFNDPDLNSFPADIHQKWLIMVDAAMPLPLGPAHGRPEATILRMNGH